MMHEAKEKVKERNKVGEMKEWGESWCMSKRGK